MLRRVALLTTLIVLAAIGSTAQAATIWTPLSSGTTGTITSIVYQSPTRFWYATSGGTIAFWNGTAFTAGTGATAGENFVDLAFQPGGVTGYAVTSNGHVWRSTDGGKSWSQLASPPATRKDCSNPSTSEPETELNAVQWANSTTAFLLGANSTILRSTNADSPSPSFTEINKVGNGTCSVQNNASQKNMTDATFLPVNPANALFVDQDFGELYESSNALSASVSGALVNVGTVNSFTGNPHIAQDAVSPNRIWVVDHRPGESCGTLCLELSSDGGNTTSPAKFVNDSTVIGDLYDISSQGGVEVTAGSGGEIFTSVDGTNFYDQPAEGTLATENWRAEAAFDAQHAAVGGENGALAITAAANTIPTPTVTAPIGSGTPTPTGGPPPGPPTGSKPIKLDIGGAAITIYRVVTVTGRSARFVPVVVSSTRPRRFIAQLLRLRGKNVLATGRLTLKGRHGGHGTIRVQLSPGVKPGTYRIVVRETTLTGRRVGGKPVEVKFALK